MRTSLIAALAACSIATPALASHKAPVSDSWDVTAPVPYPLDGASHCTEGVEGLTKLTRPVTLPDRGVLEIELTGFLGDWVLELFDAKGKLLGQAAMLDPTNLAPVRKIIYKKATPGQQVRVAACNVNGGPKGKVAYTFTFR